MFQQLSFEQMPENALLRLPSVLFLTGLPKSTFYARVRAGELPKPVKLGARAVAWRVGDIRKVLEELNAVA